MQQLKPGANPAAMGQQQSQQRPAQQQPQPQQQQPSGGNQNQDLYDIFVAQGIKLAQATAQKLQGKASIDLLGNALFDIVNKIETQGEKNGVKFGLDVLIHGSNEILGHLIEMTKVQVNDEQVKAIVGMGVGKWLDNAVKTGKMTAEQVVQMAQQAQQSMPQGKDGGGRQAAAVAPQQQVAGTASNMPAGGLLAG